MFGKLMKHELKLSVKKLLPMYLIFFAITIITRLSLSIGVLSGNPSGFTSTWILDTVQILTLFLYIIVFIGLILMTYFVILSRFYKNLLGDEGYLMFTLPVRTGQLLSSKLLCAAIFLFLLLPAGILSFLILFYDPLLFQELEYYASFFAGNMILSPWEIGLTVSGFLAAAMLETLVTILTVYLSMILGQHFWHEHRLLASILFYFLINAINNFLFNIVNLFVEYVVVDVYSLATIDDIISHFSLYLPGMIVVNALTVIVLYWINHHFLDKKLNLN